MFHDVTVNALGGFIGGLAVTAVVSLFTKNPQATAGTSVTYKDSIHTGDNVTHNERITVSPTIVNNIREAKTAEKISPTRPASSDETLWIFVIAALTAVVLYAQHQQWLLTVLGQAYAVALAFLAGCLTFLLAARVRFTPRLVTQTAVVALATAALWFVPHLTRTAPWGGSARNSLATLRRLGILKAGLTDAALVLFPLFQLLGLACAVLAMLMTLRFGVYLLALCRVSRLSRLGKQSDLSEKVLVWGAGRKGSVPAIAITTALSLALTSGAAWAGSTWLGTNAQAALQKLTASASTKAGQTTVCLRVTSKVGLPPDSSYTLQSKKRGGRWMAVRTVPFQTATDKLTCTRVTAAQGTEYRWTDQFAQRTSNIVR